jgi:Predicted membrane protein (DUF2306)
MTASVWPAQTGLHSIGDGALKLAARCWFVVAVAGQWIFTAYVVAFYGGAVARGNPAEWNKVISNGYTPGHTVSNIAVAAHLLLAVIIMVGGPLQLVPQLRRRMPAFHRWTGRIYMPAVVLTSLAGLYMIWLRDSDGPFIPHVGISVAAVLIILFAVLAWRYAVARDLRTHRRWALRLFMVVNAGWFFRVGLMLWIFLNQGPAGFDPKTFTGPFINVLSFADYLLPLAALELYFHAQERASVGGRLAVAAVVFVLTVAMGVGIAVATMGLWLPHM